MDNEALTDIELAMARTFFAVLDHGHFSAESQKEAKEMIRLIEEKIENG